MSREMKDSGVEWIGEIPKLWEVKKLGSLYKKRNEKVSDIDYQPLSVTKNGILPQLETAAKSNNHENRKLVLKDDFVINSRADRKMSAGTSSYDGSVSLINHVLYSEIMNPQYTNYLLKNYSFAEEFYRWGSGIVDDLWSTNWDKMKKINIPIPSRAEQIKIAQEIDAKISVISNILTETRESIENLKKYKQSLITEVVTKGLDKNVEMKDSGIEWIGEIPKDWEIKNLGTLFNRRNEKVSDTDYPPLSVTKNGILPQLQTAAKSDDHDNRKLVLINDFVINSRADRKMSSGVSKYEGSVSLINHILYSEVLDSRYAEYLLKNYSFAEEFYRWGSGIVDDLWTTSWDKMKKISLPVPSIDMQKQIAIYLDKKNEEIENLIKLKNDFIKEYESYKKSLIYEYVTGKKEIGQEVE